MAKRLVAKIDEYEKDGQKKGKYIEIGVILSNDKGEYALINPEINLAGVLMKQRVNLGGKGKGDMVMCSIFDNDNAQSQQPAHQSQQDGIQMPSSAPAQQDTTKDADGFDQIPF